MGPRAFGSVEGESARVSRQVAEMPFSKPVLLPTDSIEPNPDNPRKHFDEQSLNELASNMKEVGQLHPCIVTLIEGERYQLVVGERRLRAAIRAGLSLVWCVIRPHLSSVERLRMAISENQMRESFTQQDRVAALDALDALVEDAGLRAAARTLGISASWLSRQLALRRDAVLFPALESGQVSFAQADEIRRAPASLRQTLVDRAVSEPLPSTEIRTLVSDARSEEQRARSLQRERLLGASAMPNVAAALEMLLSMRSVDPLKRPVLLQMREAIDRLLDEPLAASDVAGSRPQRVHRAARATRRSARGGSRGTRSASAA